MKIIIKATNLKLTPAMKIFVETKIADVNKFLRRVDPELVEVCVEVGLDNRHHRSGNVFRAEANLILPGKLLRSESIAESFHSAIDQVKEELSRKVKAYFKRESVINKKGVRHLKDHLRLSKEALTEEERLKDKH